MINEAQAALFAGIIFGFLLGKLFYQEDRATLDKIANVEEQERRVIEMAMGVSKSEADLNKREAKANAIHAEAVQSKRHASAEIAKYKNIAAKARQELAGARERYKRKLKKYQGNKDAHGV